MTIEPGRYHPSVAERLAKEFAERGISYKANDNIAEHLRDGDLEAIEREAETHIHALLRALVIEPDHNTMDTARRVAKMYVREVFAGRYEARPVVTDFPNVRHLDELYSVGPITVRSVCSHHLCSVLGRAWIGVMPGERVIGLSKLTRLTQWVMARPQIQEEAVMQLADEIEAQTSPKGLGVLIRATHACMTTRGVCDHDTTMTTSVMRGALRDNHAARNEFLRLIGAQGLASC